MQVMQYSNALLFKISLISIYRSIDSSIILKKNRLIQK